MPPPDGGRRAGRALPPARRRRNSGERGISVTAIGPGPMGHALLLIPAEGGRRRLSPVCFAALSAFSKTGLTDIEDIAPWVLFLTGRLQDRPDHSGQWRLHHRSKPFRPAGRPPPSTAKWGNAPIRFRTSSAASLRAFAATAARPATGGWAGLTGRLLDHQDRCRVLHTDFRQACPSSGF